MTIQFKAVAAAFILVTMGGCAAPRLDSSCPIPNGVGCLSTQQVYERLMRNQLPGVNEAAAPAPSISSPSVPTAIERPTFVQAALRTDAAGTGTAPVTQPLYQAPRELRIWVNRWPDEDGDLHDESFLYVVVGEGRWMIPQITTGTEAAAK